MSMMMNLLLLGMLTATCAVAATLSRSLPRMMTTMSAEVSFSKLHPAPPLPLLLQDIPLPATTTTADTEDLQ